MAAPGVRTRADRDTRTITVLSYSTLCQEVAKDLSYVSLKVSNWLKRREILLREIFSFDADVMCLQDVDDFNDWWRPQLSQAGYDAIYKKRTTHLRPRQEGSEWCGATSEARSWQQRNYDMEIRRHASISVAG